MTGSIHPIQAFNTAIENYFAHISAAVHATGQLLHHDNIIYLTGEPKGRLRQPPNERKGAGAMVTYSDLFTFVIMLCAVITLVINIKRKK